MTADQKSIIGQHGVYRGRLILKVNYSDLKLEKHDDI
jgi:hypothetical protein